jgi:hypothetical protein
MKKYLSVLAVAASSLTPTLSSATLAATPVTAAELSGRTLCMSNGDRNTFGVGGRLSSTRFGNGTWAVTPAGIQMNGQYKDGLLSLVRRRNGTFRTAYTVGYESSFVVTGRYCK